MGSGRRVPGNPDASPGALPLGIPTKPQAIFHKQLFVIDQRYIYEYKGKNGGKKKTTVNS